MLNLLNQVKTLLNFNQIRWVAIIVCLWIFGCSAMHVETSSSFDWSRIGSVKVLQSQADSWNLLPAIYSELAIMGVDSAGRVDHSDLLMQFSVQEGPDIDSQGNVSNRLKSLHAQFLDPNDEKTVAVADYFYSDTDSDPAVGVKAIFARLRETFTRPHEGQAQQVSSPVSGSEQPLPASVFVEKQEAVQSPMPAEKPSVADAAEEKPSVLTAEKSDADEMTPLRESPWVPRFKSWGFENWGEPSDEKDGY